MSYEILTNLRTQITSVPTLSIGPGAYAGAFLNKVAVGLLGPKVQILWDGYHQKLAFRKANGEADSFSLRTQGAFSCAGLWSKIPKPSRRISIVGHWNEEQNLLEFSLASLIVEAASV